MWMKLRSLRLKLDMGVRVIITIVVERFLAISLVVSLGTPRLHFRDFPRLGVRLCESSHLSA